MPPPHFRRPILFAALALLAIAGIYAWQTAGFGVRLPYPQVYYLEVEAAPGGGQPLTVVAVARVVGGVDWAPGLSCAPALWDFGDGHSVRIMPLCQPLWRARIPARMQMEHTYDAPGEYTINVDYGWIGSEPVNVAIGQ